MKVYGLLLFSWQTWSWTLIQRTKVPLRSANRGVLEVSSDEKERKRPWISRLFPERRSRLEKRSYLAGARLRSERKREAVLEEIELPDSDETALALEEETQFAREWRRPPTLAALAKELDQRNDLLRGSVPPTAKRLAGLEFEMSLEEYEVEEGGVSPLLVSPQEASFSANSLVAAAAASSPSVSATKEATSTLSEEQSMTKRARELRSARRLAERVQRRLSIGPDSRSNRQRDLLFAACAAATATRDAVQLGRFCRDDQLISLLVDAVQYSADRTMVASPADDRAAVAALDALAHLVALDSVTNIYPLFLIQSTTMKADDLTGILVNTYNLAGLISKILSYGDRDALRRAALRLALRLTLHTGTGGDLAVAELKKDHRIRRYLKRTARKADDPNRIAVRVASARLATRHAINQYQSQGAPAQVANSGDSFLDYVSEYISFTSQHPVQVAAAVGKEQWRAGSTQTTESISKPIRAQAASDQIIQSTIQSNGLSTEIEASSLDSQQPVGKRPPPPTASAAYWRRKRGLLSPPVAADAAEKELRDAGKVAAALGLGRVNRISGRRGVRVLSLDGGGTRGVITVELLTQLQARCFPGREPHEVFDLIVGTSTGAILAVLLGCKKCPLKDAAAMYDNLVSRIFVKKNVQGSTNLVLRRAYYDERDIENVFEELLGDDDLLDTAEEPLAPAVACLTTLLSVSPASISLFRNYNYPPPRTSPRRWTSLGSWTSAIWRWLHREPHRPGSRYSGSYRLPVRDALRAATAAPTLFTPVMLRGQLLCDAAISGMNNPSAVALHEAKALFPGRRIDAIVSCGTGEVGPKTSTKTALGWDGIINQLVDSATSTNLVHDVISDLTQPHTYWRFNPRISVGSIDATDDKTLADFRTAAKEQLAQSYTNSDFERLAKKLRPHADEHTLLVSSFLRQRNRRRNGRGGTSPSSQSTTTIPPSPGWRRRITSGIRLPRWGNGKDRDQRLRPASL